MDSVKEWPQWSKLGGGKKKKGLHGTKWNYEVNTMASAHQWEKLGVSKHFV